MPIEPATVLVRNRDLMTAPIDQEIVILNLAGNSYIALDEVGRRVWDLLEAPRRIDDLCRQLSGEFDASEAQILADVLPFVAELENEGLLRVAEA